MAIIKNFVFQKHNSIVPVGPDKSWILVLSIILPFTAVIVIVAVSYRWIRKQKNKKTAYPKNKQISGPTPAKQTIKTGVPLLSILKGNASYPSIEEFQKLICYKNDLGQRFTTSQGLRYNREGGLNLVPENLPFDHNRIKLKRPINGCDYINANWITPPSDDATYDELIYTSYLPIKSIQFAIGQEHLPNTMDHYFRMIHEQKFDFVLSFTKTPRGEPLKPNDVFGLKDLNLKIMKTTTINKHLHRTEISLCNNNESGDQHKHNSIYFELDTWFNEEYPDPEAIEIVVSEICLIRSEMTLKKSSLKVLATDTRGGVSASAIFLSMYEIMQELDESINTDNEIKQSSNPDIDVFFIVNQVYFHSRISLQGI